MTRFTFALGLAASLTIAACSDGSNDRQPTAQEYDAIATHVGSTTAKNGNGELASMQDAFSLVAGVTPLGLALDANGHIGGSRGSLTFDYQVTCTDVNGASLPACGDATNKADIQLALTGSVDLPNVTASVDKHGHWELSDLKTAAPKLDGDGSFTFDSMIGQASYHLTYDAHYDDVVFDAQHTPVSGSIDYTIHATHMDASANDSFTVDAVITFTSDGHATITLDGTAKYSLDLTTGVVVKITA
ncbi:MAG TPA: hypothetical protein VL463_10025 [Kofleriaceae bacterium]|nr:hypothetical protein [Kofleriaceae bacterium]